MTAAAVELEGLRRTYGDRVALDDVTLSIHRAELFGLLGPNGGGKTTMFKVLTTWLPASAGRVRVMGHELPGAADDVRRSLGVVFQAPSLDVKLKVRENLRHQGHLYGLRGADLADRIDRELRRFGLEDRAGDRVEELSGGLKRRVELAKGMLHDPPVLILDEPSTGLDPAGRNDLWEHLARLRDESGVTCLVTTHLMEEAELCDRVGILDRGKLVAVGAPEELRGTLEGEVVTLVPGSAADLDGLAKDVETMVGAAPRSVGGALRIDGEGVSRHVPALLETYGDRLASVTVGRPTLLDVFLARTGREFE